MARYSRSIPSKSFAHYCTNNHQITGDYRINLSFQPTQLVKTIYCKNLKDLQNLSENPNGYNY